MLYIYIYIRRVSLVSGRSAGRAAAARPMRQNQLAPGRAGQAVRWARRVGGGLIQLEAASATRVFECGQDQSRSGEARR